MAAKATALRRHPGPRRLATLVATVRSLGAKAVDDALELRHGYRDGMEDQLGALGLILNTITLWNTVYLDHALQQLRDRVPRA